MLQYLKIGIFVENILFRINLNNMIKVSETAKSKVLQLMQDDGFDPTNDFVRVVILPLKTFVI